MPRLQTNSFVLGGGSGLLAETIKFSNTAPKTTIVATAAALSSQRPFWVSYPTAIRLMIKVTIKLTIVSIVVS